MSIDRGAGWPVSATGGPKISGKDTAKILGISYTQVYRLVDRGELLRAEKMQRLIKKQPLVFFLADVVAAPV